MRTRSVPVALVLMLFAVPLARAGGLNLRWDRCYGDGGAANRSFACNSNTGVNRLVASFVLNADVPQVAGNEVIVEVVTAGAALPAWWAFKNVGTCRQNSLAFNLTANAADTVCVDWTAGTGAGGVGAYVIGASGPNTARISIVTAVPQSSLADLPAGTEYFAFNLTINNQKTVGFGACAGCTVPACVALTSLKVVAAVTTNNVTLTNPAIGPNSNYVSWQGGDGVVPLPNGTCAGFDTAGFAVSTSVVGRGTVTRSRTKTQYPPGSPLTLVAVPLPGDRFVSWSGDTTSIEDTLAIIVDRPLSYVATFEKDPAAAPHLLAVTDYPGDDGGFVLAHWERSPLDGDIATGFLGNYFIQRRPASPPEAPWGTVQIYPAVGAPLYELAAHTLLDSTLADPAADFYRIAAVAAGDTLSWVSNEVQGYSVDNIAPPAPSPVSGSIGSGVATMFWPAVEVLDLDHYSIYRGLEASPPIDAAHRVGTTTLTGFSDSPGYYANYRVTAVDVHGNEGQGTLFVPVNSADVDGLPVPATLSLGRPTPSPMSQRVSVSLGLPRVTNVSADVIDAQGRIIRKLVEGTWPAGWSNLTWDARHADGHRAAAGIYFVHVRTSAGERFRRIVLLP